MNVFTPDVVLGGIVTAAPNRTRYTGVNPIPLAWSETLEGLKDADGTPLVPGIFAAVPYCIDLIGGPYLETRDEVCKAFRPKTALRAPRTA